MSNEQRRARQPLSRRNFLKLAAAVGGTTALAACAPQAVPVAAPSGAPAVEGSTLRVSILQGPPVEDANGLIKSAFDEKHPDVEVTFEYISGDHAEKVYTAAAAGTLADVFFSADLWVVPFAKNDVTLDLRPSADADADVDLDDVFPAMLGLGTFDNKIHMLPSALDVVTLYYNKSLFEEAGAELPSENWTWDDLILNCQKIIALDQEDDGTPKYWGLSNGTWNWWATVYPWIVGYGGKILDVEQKTSTWSDANTLAGIKAYSELWTVHNIAQPLGLDVGGDSFRLGRAAIWTHIPGTRTGVRNDVDDKFEWDVQMMPKMPDGRHRTGMGTWGMSAYGKSKNPDMAYEYIKMLITPGVQRKMAETELGTPLVKSVANDPSWMEGLPTPPTNLMAYINGADDAVLPVMDYPADCGSFYAGLVSQSYQDALEAVIRGQMSAEEAFADADDTIQSCLNQNM
jgi:multiple sugar transport system substrate-binding protein